jgi:hypothetical protein
MRLEQNYNYSHIIVITMVPSALCVIFFLVQVGIVQDLSGALGLPSPFPSIKWNFIYS